MKLKRIVSVLLTGILLVAGMPGTSSLASVNTSGRAGEMAQWVRALTALLKVLSSNPSNHMVAHNHL